MKPLRAVPVLVALAVVLALPASAAQYPGTIALPAGFQPEGITVGGGTTFFVGSIPTGAVYRGDLRTGAGRVLVPPTPGRSAIGLQYSRGRIYAAGGETGKAFVYDARTGASVATYQLSAIVPTFVNDIVVTRDAAWFTESNRDSLYRVALDSGAVKVVKLRGDFRLEPGFNLNGIDATPDGKTLIVVQSGVGKLYRVDAKTGMAKRIALGGGNVLAGDGILLDGRTLYVVQNRLDRVAVISFDARLTSGRIVRRITSPALDVPTTIDDLGDRLYAVNARFGVANPQTASYSVVQLQKR